jgi:PPOX class probable F420-dependent enzyme
MSLAMNRSECEKFLAETHVGVLCVADQGRSPMAAPVWYTFAPGGDVVFVTRQTTRKIALLRTAGRATFCVQDERPPFRYVTVQGPVRIEKVDPEPIVREEALRYVGRARGEAYLRLSAADRPNQVVVRLTPERWYSADFSAVFPPA